MGWSLKKIKVMCSILFGHFYRFLQIIVSWYHRVINQIYLHPSLRLDRRKHLRTISHHLTMLFMTWLLIQKQILWLKHKMWRLLQGFNQVLVPHHNHRVFIGLTTARRPLPDYRLALCAVVHHLWQGTDLLDYHLLWVNFSVVDGKQRLGVGVLGRSKVVITD